MKTLLNIVAALLLLGSLTGCGDRKAKPTKFTLEVTTVPAGAKIFYKSKELGATPRSLKAVPGMYRMRLEKEGYFPEWLITRVTDASVQETIHLKPITACILLTSSPSEAQIEIDGEQVGETPLVLKNQTYGHHQATIKKLGYVTQQLAWDIRNGRPQAVNASLYSDIGYLVIDSTPGEADVTVNGQPSGTTPLRKEFEQGRYRVSVTKDGFSTFEESIIVERNKTVTRTVQLTRLPGRLKLTSTPSGAAITINGKIEGSTPLTVSNLKPGTYKVTAEKAGFDPSVQEIETVAGKEIPFHFDLGANTGGIDLTVNPPGVTIYVDGKEVGKTEADVTGRFSKLFSVRNLSSGLHVVLAAHKLAVPQQKSLTVKVEKGKISRPKKITMWIANAELKLKSGRKMVGYLASETPVEIYFEPEPGVRQGFRRDEIESLQLLKGAE